jgi:hypothetical protein
MPGARVCADCPECAVWLRQAAELTGDFPADFYLGDVTNEDWAANTRGLEGRAGC